MWLVAGPGQNDEGRGELGGQEPCVCVCFPASLASVSLFFIHSARLLCIVSSPTQIANNS